MRCVQSGSLQWFDIRTRATYHRPDGMIDDAHTQGGASSLTLSPDNRTMVSRGKLDDTMKVWDSRKCSEAVMTFTGLPNLYDTTGVAFRPDGRLLVRATHRRRFLQHPIPRHPMSSHMLQSLRVGLMCRAVSLTVPLVLRLCGPDDGPGCPCQQRRRQGAGV